jgi:hypothetical protein
MLTTTVAYTLTIFYFIISVTKGYYYSNFADNMREFYMKKI